jgi:hypothetical protein
MYLSILISNAVELRREAKMVSSILPESPVMIYIVVAILVAIILVLVAAKWPKPELWHHMVRDIGIAIIVSTIVATVYELNLRYTFDLRTMLAIVDAAMGTDIPPEVWDETKKSILQRDTYRQDVEIRINVQRNQKLPEGQAELWLETGYTLSLLKDPARPIIVRPTLAPHMENEAAHLPRFEWIKVGAREIAGESLDKLTKVEEDNEKVITLDVTQELSHAKSVRIVTRRREITSVPGSYYLIIPELTKGFRLTIDRVPEGVDADVRVYSVSAESRMTRTGMTWDFDGVILPGQAIRMRNWVTHGDEHHKR